MNILQSKYGTHAESRSKFVRPNLGMPLPHDAVGRRAAIILVYYLTSHFTMVKIADRSGAFG